MPWPTGRADTAISIGISLPSVPVRVDYELSDIGGEPLPIVRLIKQWSEHHIEQVHAAREGYDTQAS